MDQPRRTPGFDSQLKEEETYLQDILRNFIQPRIQLTTLQNQAESFAETHRI
jgi:hypothetical protein